MCSLFILFAITYSLVSAQIPPLGYYFKDSIINFKDNQLSNEIKSYYLTFICEYQQAIKIMDQKNEIRKPEKLSSADSLEFISNYKAVDATDYIIKRVKDKKVVMINENHYMPQQRAYFIMLLKKLYDQGFRYLGMEALQEDSMLNKRGYPILNFNGYDGWFLYEPVMGNVVRESIKIGFNVFHYEMDNNEVVIPYNPEYRTNFDYGHGLEREIRQAFNIMKIFKVDTGAKVVILAGLGHITTDLNDFGMGFFLRRFLGPGNKNRPLAIDQTVMMEKSDPSMENMYYLLTNIEKPIVFIDEKKNSFINEYKSDQIDIQIFHPHTKYIEERPDWLYLLDRVPYYIDSKKYKIKYPVIVKAYCKGEDIEKAVPFDVIQLNDKKEKKPLLLKKGIYIIELITATQSEQTEIEIK